MREVVLLDGAARFKVPQAWIETVEPDAENSRSFHNLESMGTLRLNVVTLSRSADTAGIDLPAQRRPNETQLDRLTLRSGVVLDAYEVGEDEGLLLIRYWELYQALQGELRVFMFSYAYPPGRAEAARADLELIDREVRELS